MTNNNDASQWLITVMDYSDGLQRRTQDSYASLSFIWNIHRILIIITGSSVERMVSLACILYIAFVRLSVTVTGPVSLVYN